MQTVPPAPDSVIGGKQAPPSRRAPFAALCLADAGSMLGNALSELAIPWFVLATTGSAAKTGLTAFAGLVPLILSGLFAGVFVDRLGPRRTSLIADVASLATVGLIPLLYRLDSLPFWLLLVLVFAGALLDAPGASARAALLPDLAMLARLKLERANTIHEVIESGAGLAGPVLAGLLIAFLGASLVLWIDALSFGLSVLLIAGLVPRDRAHPSRASAAYLSELRHGLRFTLSDGPIRSVFLSATVINFAILPMLAVLLPYYMKTVAHSSTSLGFTVGAFGLGSVLGAIVFGVWGHRWPRRPVLLIGIAALGSGFSLLTLPLPIWGMGLSLFLGGLIAGPNGPLISTILQERTPADLRGRVFGVTSAIGYAGAPLGVVVAGLLIPAIGVRWSMASFVPVFFATTLVLVFDQGLRLLDG